MGMKIDGVSSRLTILILLCLVAGTVRAGEASPSEDGPSSLVGFLIVESIVAANAGLAALDPDVYGVTAALLMPLAVVGSGEGAPMWAGLLAVEGLAAWNWAVIDEDETSRGRIFVENLVAWHLFAGVVYAAEHLAGGEKSDDGPSVAFAPTNRGGAVILSLGF